MGARTETTLHNTRDFYIGKRLCNLPALRQVGFQANRRLLEVERLSHDCAVGEEALHPLNRPVEVNGQRTSALRTTARFDVWKLVTMKPTRGNNSPKWNSTFATTRRALVQLAAQ